MSLFLGGLACSSRDVSSQDQTEPSNAALSTNPTASTPVSFANVSVRTDSGIAHFEGITVAGKAGQPELPLRIVRLLLDPSADLRQVSVTLEDASEVGVTGTYQVRPAPPPATRDHVSWPPGANIVDGKDMDVYGKDAFFPPSHVGQPAPGQLDRFKLVEVPVYPYRYNPQTGELRALLGGRVVVTAPGAVAATAASAAAPGNSALAQRHAERVRALVDNFDAAMQPYGVVSAAAAPTAAATAAAAGTTSYLIITTEAIKAASTYLGGFADSKLGRNFSVELLTETTDYQRSTSKTWTCVLTGCTGGWGGGTGDVAAGRIRSWLVTNRIGHNLHYLLLVGNPHPATGDVPMKMAWPLLGDPSYPESPTDFYYAELSGNWDLNGDGNFGDYAGDYGAGGCDKYAELSVGRIPFYGDISALDHILAKIVLYEHTPNVAWRKKALLATFPLDDNTPLYQMGESIKTNVLVPKGWGSFRLYDKDYGVAPELSPTTVDNVRTSWLSFQPGLTVWGTHGSQDSASSIMDDPSALQLDDAHPALVYQGSCLTAYPENPANLAYTLLRNGAVGTVAATRVSWAFPGQTDFDDNTSYSVFSMGRNYAGYLVAQSNAAGEALSSIKSDVNLYDGNGWMNETNFNLYGDPSVGVATSGTGATAPPSPTALTGFAASGTQILLSWKAVPEASGYVVRRGTTAGGPYAVVSNSAKSTIYSDNTVTAGTRYYYVVNGVNIVGQGAQSAELAITATAQIQILYKTADTIANDAYVKPDIEIVNTGVAPVALSPLTLRYWYTNENRISQSYACDSATVGTPNVTGRFVTQSPPLVGGDTYLELSFGPNAPALAVGATSEIRSRFWKTDLSNYSENNDYSYAAQTSYAASLHITAYWNGQLVWGSIPSEGLPAPTGLTATAGNGQVSLSWTAVWGASFYVVYRSSSGSGWNPLWSGSTPSFVDTGLTNGTTYSYYVTAWTPSGSQGPASATVSATPNLAPPARPTGVVAIAKDKAASITWQAVTGATSYGVKRATASAGPYTTVATGITATNYTMSGLTNGTTYYIVVSASNAGGESPNSTAVSVKPLPPPPKVTGLMATAGNAKVTLSWSRASTATSYSVKRGTQSTGPFTLIGTSTSTSYVASGLTNGTTYYFVVSGNNSAGEGPNSNSVSATPHS
jgi:fibronectin type 3 domain-containing protein